MVARVPRGRVEREVVTGRTNAARPSISNRPKRDESEYDDFRELEDSLAIDEHALEEALRDQPETFYRVSKALALVISRRDAAKQALSDAEASADLAVRDESREEESRAARDTVRGKDKPAPASKIKLTEGEVKARVQLDPAVVGARDVFARLSEEVGKLSALKEAFQQRSYALKDLCGLYIANYYTANEHSAGGAASAMKDRAADTARRQMAEERRRGK